MNRGRLLLGSSPYFFESLALSPVQLYLVLSSILDVSIGKQSVVVVPTVGSTTTTY